MFVQNQSLYITAEPNRTITRLFLMLLAAETGLVLLDGFIYYGRVIELYHVTKIFGITAETSLGTWLSSMLFFLVAVTLWLIARAVKLRGSKWKTLDWHTFSLLFIYLSIDDTAKIHERVGSALEAYAGSPWNGELAPVRWAVHYFPSYNWQIIYIPVLGILGLGLFVLLWRDFNSALLKTLLVFAAGCLAVSQGLDFIEGLTTAIGPVHPVAALENQTARHFTMVLEEFLEMFGITLLLTALLRHLRCITAATDNSARE